jgi:NADH-quinone oxidoreductase subunit C
MSDTPQPDVTEEAQEAPHTLAFHFTPRAALAGEMERLRTENPHAKATTYLPDLASALAERFGDAIGETTLYAGETTVYVGRDHIQAVAQFLRDEAGFDYMSDMGTIDRFTEEGRFEVFYNLVSIPNRKRLRLKVRVDEHDATIPTVTGVWPGAGWHEREAWDMMGIRFEGNPDHRRVYMPEDFEYHPARKEFPTLGIPGSLPLPPREPDGELQLDPYASAHEGFTDE